MKNSKLVGITEEIINISNKEIKELYSLFSRYYDNVTFEVFEKDFRSKDFIILLKHDSKIYGFSTIELIDLKIDNRSIKVLFSGDTIVDETFWGKNELAKTFIKFMFMLIDNYPKHEIFWLLISKGYKTYRYLPIYFKQAYPTLKNSEFPDFESQILDLILKDKYSLDYDKNKKVVIANNKDRLKDGIADIDEKKLKNSDIKFFYERNPGYKNGDELACITKVAKDNFKDIIIKIFKSR